MYTIENQKIYYNETIKNEIVEEQLKNELANVLINLASLTARKEELEKTLGDYDKVRPVAEPI